MSFTGYETLRFSHQARVLTITIDGPGPVNAVNERMHEELARVFTDAQRDPDSDIVVLTGAGRAFCAGGDMDWFDDMIADQANFRNIAFDAKRIVTSLLDLEKPLICRLNGAAAGLGASIALLCDVIIADDKAVIGDPHVKVGLVAGDGGAVIWAQQIGFARAKEFLMTGELLSAPRAAELGLINYAVPREALDDKVGELIAKISGNPRWAVRWTKTVANIPLKELAVKVMDAAVGYEAASNTLADRVEAVQAFRERRPGDYKGN